MDQDQSEVTRRGLGDAPGRASRPSFPGSMLRLLGRAPWDLALMLGAAVMVGWSDATSSASSMGYWVLFWMALGLVLARRVGHVLLDNLHLVFARFGLQGSRAPSRYVRALFEDYAHGFEDHLLFELDYRAPNLIRGVVDRHIDPKDAEILDLGCGTGLCGPLFRQDARALTGLDLSPAMLERAEMKGCYDQLIEGDLVGVLRSHGALYDLALASDVFVYFGDLRAPFAAVRRVIREGGHFAFTTESLRPEDAIDGQEWEWHLGRSGRYEHAQPYVARLLAEAGFAVVACEEAALRLQGGAPVAGRVWLVRAGVAPAR